jgi:K+-transporting ATPase c subunit
MATNNNDFLATMMLMGGKGDNSGFSQIVSIILLSSLEYIKRLMDIFVKRVQQYFEKKAKMMIDCDIGIGILKDNSRATVKLKYQRSDDEKNDDGNRRDFKYIEAVFYKLSKLRNISSLYMSRDTFVPGIIKKEFNIEKDIIGIIDELAYDKKNMLSNCIIRIESNIIDSVDLSNCISRWHQEHDNAKEYDLIQNKYIFSIQMTNTKMDFSRYNTGNSSAEEMEIKMAPKNIIFSRDIFHSNRRQSNLYGNVVKNIFKRVNFFKDNEEWYKKTGIPYQLGCLFRGKPGTGKSSVIKAIANELDRHVISINFRDIQTTNQFYNLFSNEYIHYTDDEKSSYVRIPLNKRLYVLEEIDTLGDIVLDREFQATKQKVVPGKLTLGDILNVFDGNNEYPGRVIVLTTNYAEKLDRALLRAGRMDINVEFDCPRLDEIQSYTNFFYKRRIEDLDIQDYNENENRLSFADITQVLFETDQDETYLLSDKLKIKWKENMSKNEKAAAAQTEAAAAAAKTDETIAAAQTDEAAAAQADETIAAPADETIAAAQTDEAISAAQADETISAAQADETVRLDDMSTLIKELNPSSKDVSIFGEPPVNILKLYRGESDMKEWVDTTIKKEDTYHCFVAPEGSLYINGLQPSNIVDFTDHAPVQDIDYASSHKLNRDYLYKK